MGPAGMKRLHHINQKIDVVVATCHEVASSEVDPFQLWKPSCELLLYMLKGALKHISATLTMTMAVEAANVTG